MSRVPVPKIILFIVEGIWDQTSLSVTIERILKQYNKGIRFYITNGDICFKEDTSLQNPIYTIVQVTKEFIKENKRILNIKDIDTIIHLVDTDGCFVSNIIESSCSKTIYHDDFIEAKNCILLKKSFEKKAAILNDLYMRNTVNIQKHLIKYKIYYFSRNLEHVLHGDSSDLSNDEKKEYANIFSFKFAENPKEFIEFMSSDSFAVKQEYKESWKFIMHDSNSLKRFCNFHLFLENIEEEFDI